MKPMSLLACGIVVSLFGGTDSVHAQSREYSLRASAKPGAPPQELTHAPETAPPAPRGDLRGDIASNVRARPETDSERNGPPRRR
jgi:hypothetical protein